MRIFSLIMGLGLVLNCTVAGAQQTAKKAETGEQTRAWLALQGEGQAASDQRQPIAGPVAAKIYQRYQHSFSHPIPEYFSGDDANASVLGD